MKKYLLTGFVTRLAVAIVILLVYFNVFFVPFKLAILTLFVSIVEILFLIVPFLGCKLKRIVRIYLWLAILGTIAWFVILFKIQPLSPITHEDFPAIALIISSIVVAIIIAFCKDSSEKSEYSVFSRWNLTSKRFFYILLASICYSTVIIFSIYSYYNSFNIDGLSVICLMVGMISTMLSNKI